MNFSSTLGSRLTVEAATCLALSVASLSLPTIGVGAASPSPAKTATCAHSPNDGTAQCVAVGAAALEVALPGGSTLCPNSGAGVACSRSNPAGPDVGFALTPNQMSACSPQLGPGGPGAMAACTDAELAPPPTTTREASANRLELKTDTDLVASGSHVTLTATADQSVRGTGQALEIFDTSTHSLIGSCSQGSQCVVDYHARAGRHSFNAYLTPPTTKMPTGPSLLVSNEVQVRWVGLSLSADRSAVGPGHPVVITATATMAVDELGRQLQIYDLASGARIAYCSTGSACRTSLTSTTARSLRIVAIIGPASPSIPSSGVIAESAPLPATWLSVSVSAFTNDAKAGGIAHVVATANGDITGSGWSIGIFDDHGQMVGPVCTVGAACRVDVKLGNSLPSFRAAIGVVPTSGNSFLENLVRKIAPPTKMADIQAQSDLVGTVVRPKILWGVDSCKSLTDDSGGTTGLYPAVAATLGAPDFWGRYLTYTVCPAISGAEIAAAHNRSMGILPIYNDYPCSDVAGYDTGRQYGREAAAAARGLGIPGGVALAIDIEAPGDACPGAGSVDAGFVVGWYDGITGAGYVAAYYGNGTAGSPFANAYCAAVSGRPDLANNSHLWSYEPSLSGGFAKGRSPDMGMVANTQCPEHGTVWQFVLSAGSTPDVDQDLLSSDFPLWYP